jgi:pimeloyl-ACP methyl ester carboxylesterase
MRIVRLVGLLALGAAFLTQVSACSSVSPAPIDSQALRLPSYVQRELIGPGDRISDEHKVLLRKTLPEAKRLIVLVHGWSGDVFSSWGRFPDLLAGGLGDQDGLEWTRRFNVFVYGYPTLAGGRELDRQARLFITQVEHALDLCGCDNVYVVAHSMGALVVTRAIATSMLDSGGGRTSELAKKLSALVFVSPAFQLSSGFDRLAERMGLGPTSRDARVQHLPRNAE